MKRIAFYTEASDLFGHAVLTTIYLYKISRKFGHKQYHVKDMYHKDMGKYNEHMFKELLCTYAEIKRRKLGFVRDGIPVHPYFNPMVYNDRIEYYTLRSTCEIYIKHRR